MALTPLATGTNVSETIGGKEYGRSTLHDAAGADAMGAVGSSPAANTLLGRLKAIVDAITSLLGTNNTQTALTAPADDIFAITPSDTADLATIPKSLVVTVAGNLAVRGTGGTTVTFPVTAGQIVPLRARRVMATGTTATVAGMV